MKPLLFATLLILALPLSLSAEEALAGADFDAMDANHDGVVSQTEFLDYHVAELKKAFAALDKDANGQLEKADLGEPVQTAAGLRFAIPQIVTVKPDAAIHPAKVRAGTRGPAGPMSRRIAR